jgi:hypothetical protein
VGYDNDTIQVRVLVEDAEGNADTLERAAADLIVDTKSPTVATSAFIVGGVVDAGALSFDVDAGFTETNPGTNTYSYMINGGAAADSSGESDVEDPIALTVSEATTVDGDDSIEVYATHTDDMGHWVSDTSSGYYVKPYTPQAPTVDNPRVDSVDVTINPHASEATGLEYAIQVDSSGTTWWVQQIDGSRGSIDWALIGTASGEWGDISGIDSLISVSGLSSPVSQYTFQVKSRNKYDAGVESDLSPAGTAGELAPELYDTSGGTATVPSSQRADGSDTVDLYYQLADGDNVNDAVTVEYREGLSGSWATIANMVGDTGVVSASDSSLHRQVRWGVSGEFGVGYDNDTIQVRVLAEDAQGNADTLERAAADLVVDTKAPTVATSAFIVGGVVNAGALSFDVDAGFTEQNPGTNTYSYVINSGTPADSSGESDVEDPSALTVSEATEVDGDDSIVVYATHTDDFGHWVSDTSLGYYVKPYPPAAPSLSSVTYQSIDVSVNKHASEAAGLYYGIQMDSAGTYWWVQGDGSRGSDT